MHSYCITFVHYYLAIIAARIAVVAFLNVIRWYTHYSMEMYETGVNALPHSWLIIRNTPSSIRDIAVHKLRTFKIKVIIGDCNSAVYE